MRRPGVVLFGEALAEPDWTQARQAAEACDVMIVVGTSGEVWPAATLPQRAAEAGATVIRVDPEADGQADIRLSGPAGEVLPALKGKMHGVSVRVPTPNVSLVDLTVVTSKKVTAAEVTQAFRHAAEGPLKGVRSYSEALTVSVDYNGDPHSAIVDGTGTFVVDDNLVKVMAWYDNEWGFSNRMVDVAKLVVQKGV